MCAFLFKYMLGVNTARNHLKEDGLKSRRSKTATLLTARHKQEQLRLAYKTNVLDKPAMSKDIAPIEHILD